MTGMHIATIRRILTEFIETKMAEQDAKYQDVDLFGDEPRCPLVNPACPGDFCVLPAGHAGTMEEVHILGTDNYRWAVKYHNFPMADIGTSDKDLYELGIKVRNEQDERKKK